MSSPPRPPFWISPSGEQQGDVASLDYLKLEFSEFLALAKELAQAEVGMDLPGGEGDISRTLLELPALLAHILAAYQDLYGREAFISTAHLTKSLIRHAQRLAYEPDAGLAATGYQVLTIKDGLEGRIPQGFAFLSTPLGEAKAQTYETLADLDVKAEWNELIPVDARQPTQIVFRAAGNVLEGTIPLEGTDLGLELGEYAVLEGQGHAVSLRIVDIREDATQKETILTVEAPLGTPSLPVYKPEQGGYRLLASPTSVFRLFGWDANPSQFPPSELEKPTPYIAPSVGFELIVSEGEEATYYFIPFIFSLTGSSGEPIRRYGYQLFDGHASLGKNLFLSAAVEEPEILQVVMLLDGDSHRAYQVTETSTTTLGFYRGELIDYPVPQYSGEGENFTVTSTFRQEVVETHISGTVTALKLREAGQTSDETWDGDPYPIRAKILAHWGKTLPVAATRPNPELAIGDIEVTADLEGMRPGRSLILSTLDEARVVPVTLNSFHSNTKKITISLPEGQSWQLGNLKIWGNVARISHGETVEEILGGSDGTTAFQRFTLKKAPVTQTPSATGGELNLEIRVNEIVWQQVQDFQQAKAEDRVYGIERGEDQLVTIVFGGEGRGAIPPAGKKNIVARYRVGLGREGNVGAGRISRLKKASPLLERAINVLPVSGGTPPAEVEDMRSQATRYVRTLDRAVSVADYADLALLFPGVARTAARWTNAGIELIAATAEGIAPEDIEALRAFLDARRDITQPLIILEPQPLDLNIALGIRTHPAYLPEMVKLAVQEALYGDREESEAGLFTFQARGLGEAAYLSRLYQIVSGIEGVTRVTVERFALYPHPGVQDIIPATSRQWLRLKPENCDLVATAATAADQR